MSALLPGWKVALLLLSLAAPGLAAEETPPACRVETGQEDPGTANAGCFVLIADRLLMVHERYLGAMALPGGTSEVGESAQCTAARETWEETGAEVVVGRRLHTFENGFRLYRCTWSSPPREGTEGLPLPEWARDEIDELRLLDPRSLDPEEYRFPAQMPTIRQLFSDELTASP